jgi:GntR family transcriptional regulator
MALELLSVPRALVPGLDPATLAERSFYDTLRQDFGIEISGGSQTMEATVTDPSESELLGVPELSPALLVERVTWDQHERRVEAVRSVYRGDRYKFHIDLSRLGSGQVDR